MSYTLEYDHERQLVSVTTGGSTTSFAYDATGRRVSRTAGGTTTAFLYDGGKVLLETQGATTSATYSYGTALTRKDGEFPLFDGHGSERTVTNSSQSVTGTLNLDAFGMQAGSTGSSTDPYEYAATSGYRSDGDAGLALVGARYYDAQVGRFVSRDTDLTEKTYCYCNGDPVNATDTTGHFPDPYMVAGGILIVIGGIVATTTAPLWIPVVLIGGGTLLGIYGGIHLYNELRHPIVHTIAPSIKKQMEDATGDPYNGKVGPP